MGSIFRGFYEWEPNIYVHVPIEAFDAVQETELGWD